MMKQKQLNKNFTQKKQDKFLSRILGEKNKIPNFIPATPALEKDHQANGSKNKINTQVVMLN